MLPSSPSSFSSSSSMTRMKSQVDGKIAHIFVGDGMLKEALAFLHGKNSRRFFLISEPIVWGYHGTLLKQTLQSLDIETVEIILPEHQRLKSFSTLEWLCERILSQGVLKDDGLLSFGGGVVTDLVGFAASILHRGLDVVHIPTTLLAQVDAAIGGKTAINTAHGKNLVGTFHYPSAVLCDVVFLRTLSQKMMRSGYAEIVKYGVLGNSSFFSWLEKHGSDVLSCRPPLRDAVEQSCHDKNMIVQEDARESMDDRRVLLNLGHTFAHGLEAASDWTVMHGEAVSVGMALASQLSYELSLCSSAVPKRLIAHLKSRGLPVRIADLSLKVTAEKLLGFMMQDKKNRHDGLRFVLLKNIGEACVDCPSIEVVRKVIKNHLSGKSHSHNQERH